MLKRTLKAGKTGIVSIYEQINGKWLNPIYLTQESSSPIFLANGI